MTTAELTAALDAANTGTPDQSVESAITVYLAASSDELAHLLQPHRKQTERAGAMRIVPAK